MANRTPWRRSRAFRGQKPPAPAWFERVLAIEPERSFVAVEGAEVETLAWGERGKPGPYSCTAGPPTPTGGASLPLFSPVSAASWRRRLPASAVRIGAPLMISASSS